jgi:dihydrofolate synthase / folylpolyglutamate synthase
MSVDDLWNKLSALAPRGMRFSLEPLQEVLGQLGHPERGTPSVHIAGSNGKGSTSAFLAAILAARGERVGLYTSPHLVSVRERAQVLETSGSRWFAEDAWLAAARDVEAVVPGFGSLTFFEVLTAIGLVLFRQAGTTVNVIEAGLGARLDATRLIEAQLSVLTEVGLEHCDVLGPTLEDIAYEEGSVMRPNQPLVMADGVGEAMAVVDRMADAAGVTVYRLQRDFSVHRRPSGHVDLDLGGRRIEDVQLALPGSFQARNAALAAKAAELFVPDLSTAHIRAGLGQAVWPGRFERFGRHGKPVVLLDAAHNPQAAVALMQALAEARGTLPQVRHLVLGLLGDKDAAQVVAGLGGDWASVVLTTPRSPRARPADELRPYFAGVIPPDRLRVVPDPEAALAAAEHGAGPEGLVVVCGSLYVIGALRPLLVTGSSEG